jgi:hypothetical protein
LAEVIDLRQHGVSTRQILRNARTYCIAFALSDSVRRELSGAGADTTLVGGLADVCSTDRPPAHAGAPPVIDDEFARTTASQAFAWSDRRCKARFESGGVRIENRSADALCLMRYPSAELGSSVRIELKLSQLGSSPSGVVLLGFGRSGTSNRHYAVAVGADRRVQLCWNADGVCSPLSAQNGVQAVLPGASDDNSVAVEIHGQEIGVAVNGSSVLTYKADDVVTGRLSLGAGPATSLLLVHLRAQNIP